MMNPLANFYFNQLPINTPLLTGFIPTTMTNQDELIMSLTDPDTASDKTSPTSTSPASESSPKMVKKDAPPASTPRIKRPMNAFMVWSQIRRQEISANGGKFHNSDISKMLGAEWRTMAEADKVPFVERARALREEHFREHPDYVYRPRRRKRNTKVNSTESNNSSTDEPPVDQPQMLNSLLLNHLLCSHFFGLNQPSPNFFQNMSMSPTTPVTPHNPMTF